MTTAKRVLLYARCSTADQNTAMQIDELRALATQRGWKIAAEYVDEDESGAKDRRPELDKLMAHARRGGGDAVLCWRFDRFARSVKHLVLALDEFRSLGLDFVSMHEAIDTGTPMGRAMFTIIGAIAELEREIIRERTIAGVAAARRRGRRIGRPPAEKRTDGHQGARLDVDRAVSFLERGTSLRATARELGTNTATLRRALARAGVTKPPPFTNGARPGFSTPPNGDSTVTKAEGSVTPTKKGNGT